MAAARENPQFVNTGGDFELRARYRDELTRRMDQQERRLEVEIEECTRVINNLVCFRFLPSARVVTHPMSEHSAGWPTRRGQTAGDH